MSFQFISGDIGPDERRLIRAHVMVGKNAGRPRPSRKKQRATTLKQVAPSHKSTRTSGEEVDRFAPVDRFEPALYDRLISNDLAFNQLSQQSDHSVQLLREWIFIIDKRLYPVEFCSKLDFMNCVWLQYIFYDEGYMHGVLAIKASFTEPSSRHAETLPNSLEHLSKAYRITQRRLNGPKATSDAAIACVTILTIYQLVHGHAETGQVHFNGLCRMVQARGGIAKLLKDHRALAQKPWRIDLEFALQSGLPMRFANEIPVSSYMTRTRPVLPTHTKLLEDGVNAELVCILSDVTTFTDTLNTIDEASKLDPLDFAELAFSLIHRLLGFSPLRGFRLLNAAEDLLQLSLLAMMTTALPTYTEDVVRYELLSKELKRAVQRYVTSKNDDLKLLLWAVFVGRVSILHDNDDEWVIPVIQKTTRDLQVQTWTQLRQIFKTYCWIHTVQDANAKPIWERARREEEVQETGSECLQRMQADIRLYEQQLGRIQSNPWTLEL